MTIAIIWALAGSAVYIRQSAGHRWTATAYLAACALLAGLFVLVLIKGNP